MQSATAYVPTDEQAELIRLSKRWMHLALVDKDEAALRNIMAPEYTLQIWDASRVAQNLDTWMHVLLNRLQVSGFEYTSLNAWVFGDTGVVYSAFWWRGVMDGHVFSDSGFMADTWLRRSGSWQVVARRSAPQQQIQQLRSTQQ